MKHVRWEASLGDEGAEPNRGQHVLAFGDLAHDQVAGAKSHFAR